MGKQLKLRPNLSSSPSLSSFSLFFFFFFLSLFTSLHSDDLHSLAQVSTPAGEKFLHLQQDVAVVRVHVDFHFWQNNNLGSLMLMLPLYLVWINSILYYLIKMCIIRFTMDSTSSFTCCTTLMYFIATSDLLTLYHSSTGATYKSLSSVFNVYQRCQNEPYYKTNGRMDG